MAKKQIPSFWYATAKKGHHPILATLLSPLSATYQGLSRLRQGMRVTRKSPIPVICIGNVTIGGGGKTPTARAILDIVREHGKFATPCLLMRGYGGKLKGPTEVDLSTHTSWHVGDEALMQARYAPVIISRDRYKGAQLAAQRGYDLIIMDDGFQNQSIKKDISFLVVDGGFGFGNGCCFPAGPLREPVSQATSRADATIIVNRTKGIDLSALDKHKKFDGQITLSDKDPHDENKVIAFAGIARPEKFFQTLADNGYNVHSHFSFPDHYMFTHNDLDHMYKRAQKTGRVLITTEKDWARLSARWRERVDYLRISIGFGDDFKTYLIKKLDKLS